MTRKTIVAIVSAVAVAAGVTAVGAGYALQSKDPVEPVPAQEQHVGVDRTVEVEPVNITGKDVTEIGSIACFATIYNNPTDLLAGSNAAVYAQVESVEYFTLGGVPWNKMDVLVLDAYKGDVQAGDRISITQFGGYLPLAEQIRVFNDGDKFSNMTQEEIDNTVFKKTMEGAPLPEVGERGVYFLVTDSTPDLPEGAYEVKSSFQGKYILNDEGNLERYAPTEGYYRIGEPESRAQDTDRMWNGERAYTVEEMAALLKS